VTPVMLGSVLATAAELAQTTSDPFRVYEGGNAVD
jgi:hypothetical protein